jgi:hypothetical protein
MYLYPNFWCSFTGEGRRYRKKSKKIKNKKSTNRALL